MSVFLGDTHNSFDVLVFLAVVLAVVTTAWAILLRLMVVKYQFSSTESKRLVLVSWVLTTMNPVVLLSTVTFQQVRLVASREIILKHNVMEALEVNRIPLVTMKEPNEEGSRNQIQGYQDSKESLAIRTREIETTRGTIRLITGRDGRATGEWQPVSRDTRPY